MSPRCNDAKTAAIAHTGVPNVDEGALSYNDCVYLETGALVAI
jgi:hypothetical protein